MAWPHRLVLVRVGALPTAHLAKLSYFSLEPYDLSTTHGVSWAFTALWASDNAPR